MTVNFVFLRKKRRQKKKLFDGNEVECVYIPEKNRATLCISSQVGCTLNCKFCHTGTQRLAIYGKKEGIKEAPTKYFLNFGGDSYRLP